jgi:uncharacterized membrane protein
MPEALISSPEGVLAVLAGVASLFFFLEKKTKWKLFDYLPPLIFIYLTPVILSNTGVIATSSPAYSWLRSTVLPMILVLLLMKVDVAAAFRVMGKGVFVMLFGTLGVVVGAPLALLIVKSGLGPDAWKAFGTLAGSWIGGTGNMAAVSEMIDTQGTEFGLAVLGDTVVYIVWLPIMLGSKKFAGWFSRFSGVDADRVEKMEAAAKEYQKEEGKVELYHYIYLIFIGIACTWGADQIANRLPELNVPVITIKGNDLLVLILSTGTWKILLISFLGLGLSFTKARHIPGSFELAMGLIYIFVARMGAVAEMGGLASQALPFLAGAFIWIFIHGGFCLLGARLFKVDVHTAAIASAANIGGAASAPIVAAYHRKSLVPASILLALIGYAIGNQAGYLTAMLCRMVN